MVLWGKCASEPMARREQGKESKVLDRTGHGASCKPVARPQDGWKKTLIMLNTGQDTT
jgi:hypothetical protein